QPEQRSEILHSFSDSSFQPPCASRITSQSSHHASGKRLSSVGSSRLKPSPALSPRRCVQTNVSQHSPCVAHSIFSGTDQYGGGRPRLCQERAPRQLILPTFPGCSHHGLRRDPFDRVPSVQAAGLTPSVALFAGTPRTARRIQFRGAAPRERSRRTGAGETPGAAKWRTTPDETPGFLPRRRASSSRTSDCASSEKDPRSRWSPLCPADRPECCDGEMSPLPRWRSKTAR